MARSCIVRRLPGPFGGSRPTGHNNRLLWRCRAEKTTFLQTGQLSCAETLNGKFGRELNFSSIADRRACGGGPVPRTVERLFRNTALSLASSELFTRHKPAPVFLTEACSRYGCDVRSLVLAYGIASAVTSTGALVGVCAFWVNEYGAGTSSSNIPFTMRNRDLDGLARG